METHSGCSNSRPFDTTALRELVLVDFESPARSCEVLEGFWLPVFGCKEGSHPRQPHRLDGPVEPQDGHHPPQVVGQYMQAHLRPDVGQPLGNEMGVPHPALEGAEHMLDRSAPDRHRIGRAVQAALYGFQHVVMFPT